MQYNYYGIKKKQYFIKGYITNLGKYNEGELIGKWIDFPISNDKLQNVLSEIGINEEYEEWFFTDYEGDYPRCISYLLTEYTSVQTLNKLALALDKVCSAGVQEQFIAFMEYGNSVANACANAIKGNGLYIKGSDHSALAHFYIDETGGVENLSDETLQRYFDYEAFGRDVRIEHYNEDDPDQTAGVFWCGDENATDREIGLAVIDSCGFESIAHKDFYFDYEDYGRTIFLEGNFVYTDNGIVDCSDNDDSLGKDFESELEEELEEEKGEER